MSVNKLIQLKPEEKIIAIYRQYGWTAAGTVVLACVLIVLPFFLLAPLFARGPLGVGIFFLILGIGIVYSLHRAMHWYYTMFIVTDRRIVDVDQRGFFDRTVSEVLFSKIQDVSYRIKGVFPTLLHYGTVIIQTAAGTPNVALRRMKNPERIVELINEYREKLPPSEPVGEEAALEVAWRGLPADERRKLMREVQQQSREDALHKFFNREEKR